MNYATLLQTFAVNKSGHVVSIGDVARGAACECFCPRCRQPLLARHGDIRVWHFAHQSVSECVGAAESALHLAAKEIIRKAGGVTLPSIHVERTVEGKNGETVSGQAGHPAQWIDFSRVLIEEPIGEIRPDIIGEANELQHIIEINITHAVDEEKRRLIEALHLPAIEISVTAAEAESWDWETLENAILHASERRHWIFYPGIDQLAELAILQAQHNLAISEAMRLALPIKHRFKKMQMIIDVTERDFGTTVWCSYHPQVSPFLKSICRPLGGRWKPEYKNWIVPKSATKVLLDAIRMSCDE